MQPSTEAFNRSAILPDYAIGPVGRGRGGARADQVDADQAAVAGLRDRPGIGAGEHPQRVARRPAGCRLRPARPGAVLTDTSSRPRRPWFDVETAAGGRAVRVLWAEASIVSPGPARRGLSRYAGDEQLLGPPRDDDTHLFDVLQREIDCLSQQATCRSGSAAMSTINCAGKQAWRCCARRTGCDARPEHGMVVFYEDFPYAMWNDFRTPGPARAWCVTGLPAGVSLFRIRRYRRPDRTQDHRHQHLREQIEHVRRHARDGRRGPPQRRGSGGHRRCGRPADAIGGRPRLSRWQGRRRADRLIVLAALAAGILIRLWLLPMPGLEGRPRPVRGVVHHIATQGLGLYGTSRAVSFGSRWPTARFAT